MAWFSLRRRLRQARALSLMDGLTLAEAWLALLVFFVALRLRTAERLGLTPSANSISPLPGAFLLARRAQRRLRLATRLHLIPMTCLPQSLALRWMLARRGIPARIRLGVQATSGAVRAHAWVEVDSRPVGESSGAIAKFHPLESYNPNLTYAAR